MCVSLITIELLESKMPIVAEISKWLMISVFGISIIWDIVAIVLDRSGTISKVTIAGAISYPSIPLALGILIGHLLWPMVIVSELGYWKYSLPFAFGILVVCACIDFTIGLPKTSVPMLYFLIGALIGHFLWPQKMI